MNQEKIGKFIQNCRKEKNLTQRELAEKLGVSNRAVSKWESGVSMPDLSLFQPLCKELDITINELFDGERKEEKIPDENIINTINLADKKYKTDVVGYLIYKILGIVLIVFAHFFMGTHGLFPTICLVVGAIFLIISSLKLTNSLKLVYKIIINIIYIFIILGVLFLVDHSNVVEYGDLPRLYIYHKNYKTYEVYYKLTTEYYFCKDNEGNIKDFDFIYHNDLKRKKSIINNCNNIYNNSNLY